MTVAYSVLSFLWKDNMVQTNQFISKYFQKWHPLFGSQLSMKGQNGCNGLVYFQICSEIPLCYSVLNFLRKDNMVQTRESISKFSLTWYEAIQFSVFSEKKRWFKPSSLFLNFLKSDIRLFSSQFSLRKKHGSNEVVYF